MTYHACTEPEFYYRCTACSECFFRQEEFFNHAQEVHCRLLRCQGHNPDGESTVGSENEASTSAASEPIERAYSSPDATTAVQIKVEPPDESCDNNVQCVDSLSPTPTGQQPDNRALMQFDDTSMLFPRTAEDINLKLEQYVDDQDDSDFSCIAEVYGTNNRDAACPSSLVPFSGDEPRSTASFRSVGRQPPTFTLENVLGTTYGLGSSASAQRAGGPTSAPSIYASAPSTSVVQAPYGNSQRGRTTRAVVPRASVKTVVPSDHAVPREYKCPTCNADFVKRNHLQSHLRKHSDKVLHCCVVCDYSTRFLQCFKRHMSTHTGEKPFKCSICSFASARAYSLKLHVRRHVGERPFKCDDCDAAFTTKNEVKLHQHIHTGEKRFKCNCCLMEFSYSNSLRRHMARHPSHQYA
ncbi:PREDICTED: zinc finger protein 37-like [Priapulus caudatus]|uniref:Zinc finger protein 37-like n=1 Tax=Priapulus caudatus TaxID=37621 RepID=A0ABM1E3L7_PRICU|nr:PREDICTED: zinc finger protein 37-like [Priapulus caudatus]XP_014666788.1 PREDICTED: zinc finger protein 37-like [Priapulus caudatus]